MKSIVYVTLRVEIQHDEPFSTKEDLYEYLNECEFKVLDLSNKVIYDTVLDYEFVASVEEGERCKE